MSIDLSAIQSIRGFDLASSLSNGLQLRQARDEAQRGNALRGFMARHGAGLIAGDRNALAGYAALDPAGAMGLQNDLLAQEASRQSMTLAEAQDRRAAEAHALGLQSDRQAMGYRSAAEGRAVEQHALGMDMDRQAMGLQAEQARRVAEDYARGRKAEDLAAEAAELEADLRGAAYYHRAGDREGFEAHLAQAGVAPGTVTFDGFPAMAARMEGVLSTWTALGPPEADLREVDGRLYSIQGGQATPVPGVAEPERPRPMTPEERAAWNLPADAPYGMGRDGMPKPLSGGGVSVEVNNAGEGVETGTIPPGYARVTDPRNPSGYRFEAIPGGPAEAERAAAERQRTAAAASTQRSGNIVREDIARLASMIEGERNEPILGVTGGLAARAPGTEAADARALVDTISGNIAFDRLTQMRAESPTGGALGSVTERELALLSSVLGSLSFSQSRDEFLRNLRRLDEVYGGIVDKAARTGDGTWVPRVEEGAQASREGAGAPQASAAAPTRAVEQPTPAAAAPSDIPPVPARYAHLYTPEKWAEAFARLSPEEQEAFR